MRLRKVLLVCFVALAVPVGAASLAYGCTALATLTVTSGGANRHSQRHETNEENFAKAHGHRPRGARGGSSASRSRPPIVPFPTLSVKVFDERLQKQTTHLVRRAQQAYRPTAAAMDPHPGFVVPTSAAAT